MKCDEIDIEICSMHPHNNQPCDGDCGDMYLRLTVKDWRNDIQKAQGELESLRGGILLDDEMRAKVRAIFERITSALSGPSHSSSEPSESTK
jgi:hypothetical protein